MKIPQGFLAGGIAGGIKKRGRDLGLILCPDSAITAGVFTGNLNCSYSVEVCRKNIDNDIRALLVNSGNANCFTHSSGLKDTLQLCADCARQLGIKKEQLLFASTGIIGKKLPFSVITRNIPGLVRELRPAIDDFAESIMTTDTCRKIVSRTVRSGRDKVTVTGCVKGAGMINPSMATMLAFILTDARISRPVLQKSLSVAVDKSFNSISVDGCMSTNDSVIVMASNKGAKISDAKSKSLFSRALQEVCIELAKLIVKDGEGATKFLQIDIKKAKNEKEARLAFQCIAGSLLFQTALYGENPNWGRVIAALGHAGIKVSETKFRVAATSLKEKNIVMTVYLGRGTASWRGWCCDITPEYVKINAGYS